MFLYGIIRKMDLRITVILGAKLVGARTEITLLVPIPFEGAVDTCEEDVMSDVEFSLVVEKRFLDIFLNYEGSVGAVRVLLPAS